MTLRLPCLLLAALLSTACASLHSVSYTSVPADRSHPVEQEESAWGFLGIFFSNSFVDEVHDGLRKQCPGGRISGIATKFESHWYLIVVSRTVEAKGFCEQPGGAAVPAVPAPGGGAP